MFHRPSFRTFSALVAGLIVRQRRRTVVGMLLGAGLTRIWAHDRAHYFFARARWSPDQLGPALARLIVERLLPAGAALQVAVDDTLFKRRGKKVYGAAWQHDGSATGSKQTGFGNNWVVLGLLMPLPFLNQRRCHVGWAGWDDLVVDRVWRGSPVLSASPSYKGHRYPAELISHCVWLYFRFPLSFREVEELMLGRGVVVSYEMVRRWCLKFGQAYANSLRRRRPRPRPGDN